MKLGPVTIGNPPTVDPETRMREAIATVEGQFSDANLYLRERLAELEFALEDQGWRQIGMGDENNREFSRLALRRICALSRYMFLKNPLINRAVSLTAIYVWGQGVDIEAKDEGVNTIIQDFLDDPANQVELTSHQARLLKEIDLEVLGNLFFVFFSDPKNAVKVRTITVDEIGEIICNPDDAKEPWFYKRLWLKQTFDYDTGARVGATEEAYYPDWRYNPGVRPATIAGKEVMWDTPVYHVKVGALSDMKFGIPETYAALDWAMAYKSFLEDWSTIVKALSRFAWNLTTVGGNKGVAAAKAKLQTTMGAGANLGYDTNPPPVAGSTFVGTEGTKLEPVRTAGSTVNVDDSRRLLLMVSSATGLPETFFGDATRGSMATAKTLDRPTELKMKDRQTLWHDIYVDILQYVVAKKMGNGDMMTMAEQAGSISVSFPSVLEHDLTESITAIVQAATLAGNPESGTLPLELLSRLLMQALGVDDVDEVLAEMDFSVQDVALPVPPPPVDPNAPPADPNAPPPPPPPPVDPMRPVNVSGHARRLPQRSTAEAMMVEAVRELRQAMRGEAK
jgi:hypothetical protein